MPKPTEYTFKVTIRQHVERAEAGNKFGSPEGWAEAIKMALIQELTLCEIVKVREVM